MLKKIIAIITIGFSMMGNQAIASLNQAKAEAHKVGHEVSQLYKESGVKSTFKTLNKMTKTASKDVHKTIIGSDLSKGVQYIYKGVGAKAVVDSTSSVLSKTFSTMSKEIKREYSNSFIQKSLNATGKFFVKAYEVTGIKSVVNYFTTITEGVIKGFNS